MKFWSEPTDLEVIFALSERTTPLLKRSPLILDSSSVNTGFTPFTFEQDRKILFDKGMLFPGRANDPQERKQGKMHRSLRHRLDKF